tara:strand:+ start:1298 stop:2203 length:906 start_codon:yes stop_codon:yes gene_type:complete
MKYEKKLISLSGYLRGNGFAEFANEVDAMIKSAAGPALAIPVAEAGAVTIWTKILVPAAKWGIGLLAAVGGSTYIYKEYTANNNIYLQLGVLPTDNWFDAMIKMNEYLETEDITIGASENYPGGQPDHILDPLKGGLNNLIKTDTVTRPAVESIFRKNTPINLDGNPLWVYDQQNIDFFTNACYLIAGHKNQEETVEKFVKASDAYWKANCDTYEVSCEVPEEHAKSLLYEAAYLAQNGGTISQMEQGTKLIMEMEQTIHIEPMEQEQVEPEEEEIVQAPAEPQPAAPTSASPRLNPSVFD